MADDKDWHKLLNKFEAVISRIDRGSTTQEMESASAVLARLLAKHDIAEEEVRRRLGQRHPDYVKVRVTGRNVGSQAGYRRELMCSLADENGCRFYFANGAPIGNLIGPKDAIEITLRMFDRLQPKIDVMSWSWWDDVRADMPEWQYRRMTYSQIRKLKESWRRGAVAGIAYKMREATKQVEVDTGSALVVVRGARLDDAEKILIPDAKETPDPFVLAGEAYRMGARTGYGMLDKELPAKTD